MSWPTSRNVERENSVLHHWKEPVEVRIFKGDKLVDKTLLYLSFATTCTGIWLLDNILVDGRESSALWSDHGVIKNGSVCLLQTDQRQICTIKVVAHAFGWEGIR